MYDSPELGALFTAYTAAPDSIAVRLADAVRRRGADDPLIVATGSDLALYPGGGRAPVVEGFRRATRGLLELAAVSHLGPAVASLARLRSVDGSWRAEAERLLATVDTARAANDVRLWRDRIAVAAYRGREQAIADLVDYGCAVTARYLRAALADENVLDPETLRAEYLEGGPVPVNHLMVATFFLVAMDIAHRLITWLSAQRLDWARAMVVIAGPQGRATAGVTWNTSSAATVIHGASGGRLPMDRMYLAPHAPAFPMVIGDDVIQVAALEQPLREIWAGVRATMELGPTMFTGYPRFTAGVLHQPDVSDEAVTEVTEMPVIHSPQDMRALVTRMRVVLEDPRQLLSGCVTDYAVAQLLAAGNDPSTVEVPGLTGVDYPAGLWPSAASSAR